jgi:hypothetical protein
LLKGVIEKNEILAVENGCEKLLQNSFFYFYKER